jgi:hypothetical protein
MTIDEAKSKLEAVLDELRDAGYSVWGWDSEEIEIDGDDGRGGASCAPRFTAKARQMRGEA